MKTLMQKGFLAATLLACGLGMPAGAQAPDQPAGRGGFQGMQRVAGVVTAVSGDTLSIKGEDGAAFQVVTTANTRVMKGMGNPVKVADLKAGDGVVAAGNMDDAKKTLHAAFVMVQDAELTKKLRENLGKTYISGRVTAIDADSLKMTVHRQDGVDQTIGFDETTSFKRGRGGRAMMMTGGPDAAGGGITVSPRNGAGAEAGESITLADIKVGDNVAGQGSVKSGTFVPTQLMVMAPRGPREGRPGNGATPPAPPQH